MFTAIVLAIAVPSVAGAAFLALRNRLPGLVADVRGIALQTVIIMVVLLAVAGAVAGVLLSPGWRSRFRGRAAGHHAATQRILELRLV